MAKSRWMNGSVVSPLSEVSPLRMCWARPKVCSRTVHSHLAKVRVCAHAYNLIIMSLWHICEFAWHAACRFLSSSLSAVVVSFSHLSIGWAGVVKYHPNVLAQFNAFRARENTFSFGVCNGCQFMSLLGWVNPTPVIDTTTTTSFSSSSSSFSSSSREAGGDLNPRFITNACEKYVCNFVNVQIQSSNAIMLRGMEGTSLGVWVAHGEGRAYFAHPKVRRQTAIYLTEATIYVYIYMCVILLSTNTSNYLYIDR